MTTSKQAFKQLGNAKDQRLVFFSNKLFCFVKPIISDRRKKMSHQQAPDFFEPSINFSATT